MKTAIPSFLIVVVALLVTKVQSQCVLRTDKNFDVNSPLLISNAKFVYPTRQTPGSLNFAANQVQNAYCPGGRVKVQGQSLNSDHVALTCSSGSSFRAPTKDYEFKHIRCNPESSPIARNLGGCPMAGTIAEIGFLIPKQSFVRTIQLCFNHVRGRTTWAHAIIPGVIRDRQTVIRHAEFRVARYYKNIPVEQAYNRASERQMFSKIFGENQVLVDRYLPATGDHFLERGHLIARADMYYTAQQYATFYYINVLPMWQSINGGNWLAVERAVRALARKNGDIEVWAGGLYDLELPYTLKQNRMVYLATHKTTKQPALIVPKLLFKVAYHRSSNQAIVYITVNNPYLNPRNSLPEDYQVCQEYAVCRQRDKNFGNIDHGFTYCCLWSDFITDKYASAMGLPHLGNPAALQ